MRTVLLTLLLLSAASLPAQAAETTVNDGAAAACPDKQFRGKNQKTRKAACLAAYHRQLEAREREDRERIEGWRREVSEACRQNPRACDARKAHLEDKLQGAWRDQRANGEGAD